MIPSQPPLPPGWYPDQTDPEVVRYWNGAQWTAYTGPVGERIQTGHPSVSAAADPPSVGQRRLGRRLLGMCAGLTLLVAGGAGAWAFFASEDSSSNDGEIDEIGYVAAIGKADLINTQSSDGRELVLAIGYSMCRDLDNGLGVDDVLARWKPDPATPPELLLAGLDGDVDMGDFADLVSGDIAQILISHVSLPLASTHLCPRHEDRVLDEFEELADELER
jgi:hypothetical protein